MPRGRTSIRSCLGTVAVLLSLSGSVEAGVESCGYEDDQPACLQLSRRAPDASGQAATPSSSALHSPAVAGGGVRAELARQIRELEAGVGQEAASVAASLATAGAPSAPVPPAALAVSAAAAPPAGVASPPAAVGALQARASADGTVRAATAGGGTTEAAAEGDGAERLLYVGVPSGPGNREKRDRVRTAYLSALNAAHARTGLVRAEFIVGHARLEAGHYQGNLGTREQIEEEARLEEESKAFGDIRRIPLPEEYNSLPDKTLQLFAAGVEGKYSFIVKIDDDQLLHVDKVLDFARKTDPSSLVYGGGMLWEKADYPIQLGPQGAFHPYFSGHGYLLSLALAKQIVLTNSSGSVGFVGYGSSSEDVDMGWWVAGVQKNVTFSNVDVMEDLA